MKIRSSKKHKLLGRSKSNLQSLTAAALILPGLLQVPAYAADEDEVDFQYTHYQEGKRDIYVDQNTGVNYSSGSIVKAPNVLNPIEADSLRGTARISLTERIKFGFNYTQDTWGGATPVASAPVVSNAMRANFFGTPGVLIGASPLLGSTVMNPFYMDKQGNIYSNTGNSPGIKANQLTNVLSSASPETRQQGDFKLGYDWDRASVTVGGGVSVEKDYDSRFGNLGGRWDFNQKRTSINLGLSYTNSDTHATLDPQSRPYLDPGIYNAPSSVSTSTQVGIHRTDISYSPLTEGTLITNATQISQYMYSYGDTILQGNRQDWAPELGLTQILTKNAQMQLGLSYTHSAGYLSNPYKAVYVFNATIAPNQDPNQPLLYSGAGRMEARPHERNQVNGNLGYQYYIEPLNAALHAQYTVAHDDWGINAHTFEGDWVQPLGAGWTVTPRVRYYSQSAADFYAPFFTTTNSTDIDPATQDYKVIKALPNYYSSDQRLSGFGAISGGLTIAKQFAKGVSLETGFEYYSHQGGLKLGGGGEQAFGNFDYWSANAALKLNLGALHFGGGHDNSHVNPSHHQAVITPAGIMFNHALDKAGDMMVGYRYMRNEQAGDMLAGSSAINTDTAVAQGCGDQACMMLPNNMVMNMHMLELMVAATDRLTLMLMPQWTDMAMDMSMHMVSTTGHVHTGTVHSGQTGGIGDIGLYALIKLFERPGHQLVLSLGGTAPTGDVAVMQSHKSTPINPDAPVEYGMQLGSGTWDLKPSLTYSGALEAFAWGAQATGTKRLDKRNQSGYALGDIFQGSVWGGYQWTNWLSSSVRGVYTWQDSIRGEFKPIVFSSGTTATYNEWMFLTKMTSPTQQPGNYGGQFVDLGLGVNVTIPSGTFAGNTIKFEWLQPVHTDYNGYQLDRSAALTATWGVGF